jgi:TadE-like protein
LIGIRAREAGAAAVEAVIVVPVAMTIVLFAVQACIWAHAAAEVENAAARGNEIADISAGATGPGVEAAQESLREGASSLVLTPTVQSEVLPGDRIEISVRGRAESILPWLVLPVEAERIGTIQEFRTDR